MTAPDIALFLALCFFGIAFFITGIIWRRRERAASLVVMSGIGFCLCAVWWAWGPWGFGSALAALALIGSTMMLSRPAGGER